MDRERMLADICFYSNALKDVRNAIHNLVDIQYYFDDLDVVMHTLRARESEISDKIGKINMVLGGK